MFAVWDWVLLRIGQNIEERGDSDNDGDDDGDSDGDGTT
jgi:hypothetical protein